MDKQLSSPLIIESVGPATKLTTKQTFSHLQQFVEGLAPSPAKTQLERLADALGVEAGAIAPSEGEAREKKREAERSAARKLRRETREAERAAAEAASKDDLEAAIEAEERAEEEDEAEEEGMGVGDFDDAERMDDRGDVEYGDVPEDDEDEPDNEHEAINEE